MAIKIANIYYMLAYAFQGLTAGNTAGFAVEDFANIHSLFAEIILRGMTRQIKRGIHRDYSPHTETLSGVRGKIDVTKSIGGMTHLTRQLICEYDEFTEDTLPNQVVKAAALVLLHHGELAAQTKSSLKRLTGYLGGVKDVRPPEIRFDLLKVQRLNKEYKMLLPVCRLLFDGLLMTEENGARKLQSFLSDEKMHQLYERFVREYFRYHHPEFHPRASQIDWDLDCHSDSAYLPSMRSDTTLTYGGRTIIIDTKWYSKTMTAYFGKASYHSGNMYQIYSYVSNAAGSVRGNVSGVLLYAKTDEPITPDDDYMISGNRISVKTLDLSQRFEGIQAQLETIAEYLKASKTAQQA
ncbi:MAG: 5-methylcytosine-specific restriction endonuclease system specificity protein McrC [Firmicutes bacterium]|nr:5-methylcytosine-specific restriction endonuclease system specificity protein McrC [Bacillota bacterium]